MFRNHAHTFSVEPFPVQEPYLAVELPPRDQTEQSRLLQVRSLVQQHRVSADLTHLAAPVRQLLGVGYRVGGGAAHLWIMRTDSRERLAIIADQLTTSYRSCTEAWEPVSRGRPSARQHRKKRVGRRS